MTSIMTLCDPLDSVTDPVWITGFTERKLLIGYWTDSVDPHEWEETNLYFGVKTSA